MLEKKLGEKGVNNREKREREQTAGGESKEKERERGRWMGDGEKLEDRILAIELIQQIGRAHV